MTPPDVSAVAYTTESGLQWRNALYSVQWWVFALFTAYLYIRYLRDSLDDAQPARPDATDSRRTT